MRRRGVALALVDEMRGGWKSCRYVSELNEARGRKFRCGRRPCDDSGWFASMFCYHYLNHSLLYSNIAPCMQYIKMGAQIYTINVFRDSTTCRMLLASLEPLAIRRGVELNNRLPMHALT